jgi:hypothetical protein
MSMPHRRPIALSLFFPRNPAIATGPTSPRSRLSATLTPSPHVTHAHRPPQFMRQWCSLRPMVEGHWRLPRATDRHAKAPLSSSSHLHMGEATPTPPPLFPLYPAPPRHVPKLPTAAPCPFSPILLSSTPEPLEPSAASLS